jgi:hypothetical protein
MTITAKSLIQRVVETANDKTSVHWSVNELVRYLNDGMREIAMLRPEAFSVTEAFPAVAGAAQTIRSGGIKLIDVPHNGTPGAPGVAVYKCEKRELDNVNSSWLTKSPVAAAVNWAFNETDPKKFWVYPPLIAGSNITITFCDAPTDVNEAADYTTFSDLPTTTLPIQIQHANALGDYILFRQYSKDSGDAGNMARAGNHLTLFQNSLGIDKATTLALAAVTRMPRAA